MFKGSPERVGFDCGSCLAYFIDPDDATIHLLKKDHKLRSGRGGKC